MYGFVAAISERISNSKLEGSVQNGQKVGTIQGERCIHPPVFHEVSDDQVDDERRKTAGHAVDNRFKSWLIKVTPRDGQQ
jgi:hypothetical protein